MSHTYNTHTHRGGGVDGLEGGVVAEVTMSKLTIEVTVEGDKEYGCGGPGGGDGRGDGSEFGGGPGGGDMPVI